MHMKGSIVTNSISNCTVILINKSAYIQEIDRSQTNQWTIIGPACDAPGRMGYVQFP